MGKMVCYVWHLLDVREKSHIACPAVPASICHGGKSIVKSNLRVKKPRLSITSPAFDKSSQCIHFMMCIIHWTPGYSILYKSIV